MKSVRLLLVLALIACACARQETLPRGIATRVSLDRTAALVGDHLGVTIEVETPPGYGIELPTAPAADGAFASESIEKLKPIELAGAVRHHLLWTLRPRLVGEHALPLLELPLVRPDGRVQVLPVGGVPFRVRSVREEVPEQEVFFDIRPAPQPSSPLPRVGIAALLLTTLLVSGIFIQRRQRPQPTPALDLGELARRTALDLEAAFEELDARLLADRLVSALWRFIEARWQIETSACTPADLPEKVAEPLPGILRALESARFEKAPSRQAVLEAGHAARALLTDVAG